MSDTSLEAKLERKGREKDKALFELSEARSSIRESLRKLQREVRVAERHNEFLAGLESRGEEVPKGLFISQKLIDDLKALEKVIWDGLDNVSYEIYGT